MKPTVVPAIFKAKDEMSKNIARMQSKVGKFAQDFQNKFDRAGQTAFKFGRQFAVAGAVILAPLVGFTKAAVEFEDKMADIAKTTGLADDSLFRFGEELLDISKNTRTSIEDLQSIAQIGGQLGIKPDQLVAFTEAADKFNIAMGEDFGGVEEAVSQVGKLKNLFRETRDLDIAEVINRAGSAINGLGAEGAATSANMTDFALGLGALPDALKPSIENTLALGAFLEESGIMAKRGASGITGLFIKAGSDIKNFAKQMGVTKDEAKLLLAQDPLQFAKDFSKTFEGLEPDVLAKKLGKLGLNSKEIIKVVGALSTATGLMSEKQLQAAKLFEEQTSLSDEAATKNATMAAQFAMTKNKVKALSISIGNVLIPILADLMTWVGPIIERMANWVKNNKPLVKTIAKIAAVVGAASLAISGASFAIGIFQKAMVVAKFAAMAFNTVLAMNPIALMTVAAIGLGVAIYALSDSFSGLSAAEKLNNEVRQRALENTLDQRVEVTLLFNTLRRAKEGTDEYRGALSKLEQIQPGITDKYNLQTKSVEALNRAEKDLIATLIKKAEVQARQELLQETVKERIKLQEEGLGFWRNVAAGAGIGPSAPLQQQLEVAQLQQKEVILSEQVAQDEFAAANPELAKAQRDQEIKLVIEGLPDWMKAVVNGDKPITSGTPQIALGTTK